MDFDAEGFAEISRTQGKLRMEMDGETQEKDYTAVNYINRAGTIGYSEITVEGRPESFFLSKTVGGIVLTMAGEQTGPAPFPVEGYRTLTYVASGSGPHATYDEHIQALGEELPLADRPWLEKEVPNMGQRALDVTMKIFAQAVKQMDEMMSGLGSAMGQVMEGMGKAMGDAMEGMGKAMGEAFQGPGEEKPPEKAALAPPEIAPSKKKPAPKKAPAKKKPAVKKAAVKAPAKKPAVKKAAVKAPAKKPVRKPAPKKPARKAAPKKKPARKAKPIARKPRKKAIKKRK